MYAIVTNFVAISNWDTYSARHMDKPCTRRIEGSTDKLQEGSRYYDRGFEQGIGLACPLPGYQVIKEGMYYIEKA